MSKPRTLANTVATGGVLADGTVAYDEISGRPTLPTFPTGAVVGTTDTQTLTNKTLQAPNITNGLTLSGQVGTAGQVLTSQGASAPTWATITLPVTQDEINAMKSNIAMNSFRIMALGSYSFMKMVDGVADDYVDQTGINTTASSGFAYETTTKSYASGPSYSNPGGTGNRTASITVTTDLAITTGTASQLVDGTTTGQLQFTYNSNIAGKYVRFDFGSGVTRSFSEVKLYQYENTTRGFWKIQGSNNGSTWTDISSSVQLNGITTWTVTDSSAYRYIQLVGVSGGVDAAGGVSNGWGEVEFKLGSAGPAALISNSVAALTTPNYAQMIVWEEDLAALVLNTDISAWVSREAGKTITTSFATSTTSISSTAHGFVNGDRVMLSSTSGLPTGLVSTVVYYIVSAATNTFSVSLTLGGAAITFSSNGSGVHTARKMTQVTLAEESVLTSSGRILSGVADISVQAVGTSMQYAIVAPTGTAARIHATSIQWK